MEPEENNDLNQFVFSTRIDSFFHFKTWERGDFVQCLDKSDFTIKGKSFGNKSFLLYQQRDFPNKGKFLLIST